MVTATSSFIAKTDLEILSHLCCFDRTAKIDCDLVVQECTNHEAADFVDSLSRSLRLRCLFQVRAISLSISEDEIQWLRALSHSISLLRHHHEAGSSL